MRCLCFNVGEHGSPFGHEDDTARDEHHVYGAHTDTITPVELERSTVHVCRWCREADHLGAL